VFGIACKFNRQHRINPARNARLIACGLCASTIVATAASIRKRVKQRHLKALEIPNVSGDDRKLMHERAGCDHGVLVNRIRLPMHQFRALPEGPGIHR